MKQFTGKKTPQNLVNCCSYLLLDKAGLVFRSYQVKQCG